MIYLNSLTLPNDNFDYKYRLEIAPSSFSDVDNLYPWGMFENRKPERFTFSDITIFYGGNGSGKSTLLNLIAQKMQLARNARFNSSPTFEEYVNHCGIDFSTDYDSTMAIRRGAMIASDDVFKHILDTRERIRRYEEERLKIRREYYDRRESGERWRIDFSNPHCTDTIREMSANIQAKKESARRYINGRTTQVTSRSNGENALKYFIDTIKPESLTLLDEPENSLAPQWQMELSQFLYGCARSERSQLIIATHSPFILSIPGAKIYDLDAENITTKEWYELENIRCYFELFERNREYFL